MAAKRKQSVPPPEPPSESSSDDISSSDSSDEEREVQLKIPSASKSRSPFEFDDSEEEDDEEEEAKEMNANKRKLPESNPEKKKQKAKEPETNPEKKKQKAKEPETATPASSKPKSDYFKKVWSSEDEMVLIKTLKEFYSKNKRAPSGKDCELILDTMKGKLSFDVTAKQVMNKVKVFREIYNNSKKKGADISMMNEKSRAIFDISDKFWGDLNKTSKKEDNDDVDNENELNNNGTGNGGTEVKLESEFPFLIEAIGELKKDNRNLSKFYEIALGSLEGSIARDFETKFKKQRVNEAKFSSVKMEMFNKLSKELNKLGG